MTVYRGTLGEDRGGESVDCTRVICRGVEVDFYSEQELCVLYPIATTHTHTNSSPE